MTSATLSHNEGRIDSSAISATQLKDVLATQSHCFSPNGSLLATVTSSSSCFMFDCRAAFHCRRKLTDCTSLITCLTTSYDGKYIATGTFVGDIYLWSWTSSNEKTVIKLPLPEKARVTSIGFRMNNKVLVATTDNCMVFSVDVEQQVPISINQLEGMPSVGLHCSPGRGGSMLIPVGGQVLEFVDEHTADNHSSPMASPSRGGNLEPDCNGGLPGLNEHPPLVALDESIFEGDTEDAGNPNSRSSRVTAIAIAGRRGNAGFLVGYGNGAIAICFGGGQVMLSKGAHDQKITALASAPTDEKFASGSADATVKLWHWERPHHPLAVISKHTSSISGLRFHPTHRMLVTASHDGTAKLWRTNDGSFVSSMRGHSSYIRTCSFDASGSIVATSAADNTCRVWPVSKKLLGTIATWKVMSKVAKTSDDGDATSSGLVHQSGDSLTVHEDPAGSEGLFNRTPSGKANYLGVRPVKSASSPVLNRSASLRRENTALELERSRRTTPTPNKAYSTMHLPVSTGNRHDDDDSAIRSPSPRSPRASMSPRADSFQVTRHVDRKPPTRQSPGGPSSPKGAGGGGGSKEDGRPVAVLLGGGTAQRYASASQMRDRQRSMSPPKQQRSYANSGNPPSSTDGYHSVEGSPAQSSIGGGGNSPVPKKTLALTSSPSESTFGPTVMSLESSMVAGTSPAARQQPPNQQKVTPPAAATPSSIERHPSLKQPGEHRIYVVGSGKPATPPPAQEEQLNSNKSDDAKDVVGARTPPQQKLLAGRDGFEPSPSQLSTIISSNATPPGLGGAAPLGTEESVSMTPPPGNANQSNSVLNRTLPPSEAILGCLTKAMLLGSTHHSKYSEGIIFHQLQPKEFKLPKLAAPPPSPSGALPGPVSTVQLPSFERVVQAIPWEATGSDRLINGLSALSYLSQDQILDAVKYFLDLHDSSPSTAESAEGEVPLFALSVPSRLQLCLSEVLRAVGAGQRVNQNEVALIHLVQKSISTLPPFVGEGCVCYRYTTHELAPPAEGSLVSFPCLPFATRDPRDVFAGLDSTGGGLVGTLIIIWSRHSGRLVAPHQIHLGDDACVVFPLGSRFRMLDVATAVAGTERAFGGRTPPSSLKVWAMEDISDSQQVNPTPSPTTVSL